MAAQRALFVHGVGQQEKTFADDTVRLYRLACQDRGHALHAVKTWWAPFADKIEQRFMDQVEGRGAAMGMLQELTAGTLGDADLYRTHPGVRKLCFDLLDMNVARFSGQPYTAFCHSLGCLIFTDWLRQRPEAPPVTLVTMGCNIGLFYMGRPFECPKQLKRQNSWVNLFQRRDMLGFPIAGTPGLEHVHDIKVQLGGLLAWTGLSHIEYWGDKRLWSKTIPKLLAL